MLPYTNNMDEVACLYVYPDAIEQLKWAAPLYLTAFFFSMYK